MAAVGCRLRANEEGRSVLVSCCWAAFKPYLWCHFVSMGSALSFHLLKPQSLFFFVGIKAKLRLLEICFFAEDLSKVEFPWAFGRENW